jgi:hypothetical protein
MMKIQKEKVRKELVSFCLGELTAVLSFLVLFFLLKNRLADWNSLVAILYLLSLLTFILLQGTIYLMFENSIGWTDASLYFSQVFSLDDKAKTYLIGMIIENGNGE